MVQSQMTMTLHKLKTINVVLKGRFEKLFNIGKL